MIVLLLIQAYFFAPHPETLAYSDFIKLAKAGKVSDVTLSNQAIAGTLAANALEAFLPKEKLRSCAGRGTGLIVSSRQGSSSGRRRTRACRGVVSLSIGCRSP
jgi:FtsH-like protein